MTRYYISLDLDRFNVQKVLTVKQTDVGRKIVVSLHKSGTPYYLSSENYAVFVAKKPDDNEVILDTECDLINNSVVISLSPQTIAALGTVRCELQLFGYNREQLGTPEFNVLVRPPMYDEEKIESSDEYGLLNKIIYDVEKRLEGGEFNGKDGFSPKVNIEKEGKTTTITITDADGEKTATILDGEAASGEHGGTPIVVSPDEPEGQCLWFNTSGEQSNSSDYLELTAPAGVNTFAEIEGVNYGIANTNIEDPPTKAKYSFDII